MMLAKFTGLKCPTFDDYIYHGKKRYIIACNDNRRDVQLSDHPFGYQGKTHYDMNIPWTEIVDVF